MPAHLYWLYREVLLQASNLSDTSGLPKVRDMGSETLFLVEFNFQIIMKSTQNYEN